MDGTTPSVHADQPSSRDATREVVLGVEGMHCDACTALILETLEDEPAVTHVEVRRSPDEVQVTFDDARLSVSDLVAVLGALGYTATSR